MDNAYIVYDEETLTLLEVKWDKPSVPHIKIKKDLGEDFILGNKILTDWKIKISDDIPLLEKIGIEPVKVPEFWGLVDEKDEILNQILVIEKNQLKINLSILKIGVILFATIKYDPTWLIKSWDLSMTTKKELVIDWPNAKSYSYFIGRIK